MQNDVTNYEPPSTLQHGASTHSLANKTVVQLCPKSTAGSSFLLKYIRHFYHAHLSWAVVIMTLPILPCGSGLAVAYI